MTTLVSGGGIPIGTILSFAGDSPAIPEGYLLCDGSLLNRNDFSDLFDVIGSLWGTSSGIDFRIPTTQGLLLRGRANGSGFDPDRNSRTAIQTGSSTGDNVGSYQSNRYTSHSHSQGSHSHKGPYRAGFQSGEYGYSLDNNASYGTGYSLTSNSRWVLPNTSSATGSIGSSGSNQTVGNNVAVNFIIKY